MTSQAGPSIPPRPAHPQGLWQERPTFVETCHLWLLAAALMEGPGSRGRRATRLLHYVCVAVAPALGTSVLCDPPCSSPSPARPQPDLCQWCSVILVSGFFPQFGYIFSMFFGNNSKLIKSFKNKISTENMHRPGLLHTAHCEQPGPWGLWRVRGQGLVQVSWRHPF